MMFYSDGTQSALNSCNTLPVESFTTRFFTVHRLAFICMSPSLERDVTLATINKIHNHDIPCGIV